MKNMFFTIVVVFIVVVASAAATILGLTEKPQVNEIISFTDNSTLIEFTQPVFDKLDTKNIEITGATAITESTESTESVEVDDESSEVIETPVVSLFPETLLPTEEDLQEKASSFSSFRFFEEEPEQMMCELSKPVEIKVNPTKFGGSWDRVVRSTETGSVGGNRLRSLKDKEDLYIAWPMPGVNENNPKSPLKIPCVESFFADGATSISKKIENANKGLRDYFAEITYGDKAPVLARIEDRGPRISTRFDASRAVWEALGLSDVLNGSPNSPSNRVTLSIRLIHKDDVDTDKVEETEFTEVNSDNKTLWYGPQGEVTEEQIAEIQFSKIAGKKFQLPSWNSEEEATTKLASNR